MNRIEVEPYGTTPRHYNNNDNDLSIYTYLRNVWYKVEYHIEWNEQRPDLLKDHDISKHDRIMQQAITAGGRMHPFLGTSECIANIESSVFDEDDSYYDGTGLILHGIMLHGITYPPPSHDSKIDKGAIRLWQCTMQDGIITFPRPEDCKIIKPIKLSNFKIGGDSNDLDGRPYLSI